MKIYEKHMKYMQTHIDVCKLHVTESQDVIYLLRSVTSKFTQSHPARGQPASQSASQPCNLGLSILRASRLEGSAAEAAAFKLSQLPSADSPLSMFFKTWPDQAFR